MLFSFIQSLSAQLSGFQSNIGCMYNMYNHLLAWIIDIGIVVGHPINLSPAFTRHGLANIQHLYRRFLPFFFTHFITSLQRMANCLTEQIRSVESTEKTVHNQAMHE